jgi:CheY-like chemotaxis protein
MTTESGERKLSEERRNSERLPMALAARCVRNGNTSALLTQDISEHGIFFHSEEYIHQHSLALIEIDLPDGEPLPLVLSVSICFTGRTLRGFGVGVCITEEDKGKQDRWLHFYETIRLNSIQTGDYARLGKRRPSHIRVMALARTATPPLRLYLKKYGCRLICASDNRELLALIQSRSPDVVLGEVTDAALDGITLCRRITGDRRLAGVAVLLLTEQDSPAEFIAGLGAGAFYVIRKPFDLDYLGSRLFDAARQRTADPGGEPTARSERGPQRPSSGYTVRSLRFPSVLPPKLQELGEQLGELYFWTKRYIRQKLSS